MFNKLKNISFAKISNKLAFLVVIAVLPAMVILVYTGLEQRRQSIEKAKQEVLLLTHAMHESQQEITRATEQLLSTLSMMKAVQQKDIPEIQNIFKTILAKNNDYSNIIFIDADGDVLAAGRPFAGKNLADRKHIREALLFKRFTVGEYILSRGDDSTPVFPFAYPVLDDDGKVKAILTTAIRLVDYSHFFDFSGLPEKSFVAVTDHQGIRLFYYPVQDETNPIGKPIKLSSWDLASQLAEPGMFVGKGSDGRRRVFAFEQVRLGSEDAPYMYVWAGIPEALVLADANRALIRNILLMVLAVLLSLYLARLIGMKTMVIPLQKLVALSRQYAQGNLDARIDSPVRAGELGVLTNAFYEMAATMKDSQRILREREARFRLLMDSLDALVYVTDMETYEVLFINEYAKKQFGDVVGEICWQSIKKGQVGPCPFCEENCLLGEEDRPGEVYTTDFHTKDSDHCYYMHKRAIEWVDGRVVRLHVATDITKRKKAEEEREKLIVQLQNALAKIKTLSGLLPICSSCKMIRDDEGYWKQIEQFITDRSDVAFSHGICPDCAKRLYPDLTDKDGNVL